MNEQPQDIQPTQADVDSLVAKFDAFTATLTPGEHAAFGQLLQAAADGDVQGYLLAPQIVVQLQLNNGIRPPMVKGSYPPGVRTDASR